ncbi:MAG: recombination mediator RecR [Nitrospinota bacterium]
MKGPASLNNLINEFKKLPGIGRKGAERLSFFLLRSEREKAISFADAIVDLKDKIRLCSVCNSITESDPCGICTDTRRDGEVICVVEEPNDVYSIEKTKEFRGKYHVLMGAISPLEGINPSDIRIEELVQRVKTGNVKEVIVATNPNTEGEATALFLSKVLKEVGTRVTRIARGLPMGGDLEYADEVTLSRSLQGRQDI